MSTVCAFPEDQPKELNAEILADYKAGILRELAGFEKPVHVRFLFGGASPLYVRAALAELEKEEKVRVYGDLHNADGLANVLAVRGKSNA